MKKIRLHLRYCRNGQNPPPENKPLLCVLREEGKIVLRTCTYILMTDSNVDRYVWVLHGSIGNQTVIPIAWADVGELEETLSASEGQDLVNHLHKAGSLIFISDSLL